MASSKKKPLFTAVNKSQVNEIYSIAAKEAEALHKLVIMAAQMLGNLNAASTMILLENIWWVLVQPVLR